jgi:cell division topological specificity factor
MSIFDFFRKSSTAPVARERLQILLAHERVTLGARHNLVYELREEILAVIAKHVAIDRDKVQVRMERGQALSTLEIEIEIPNPVFATGNAA